MKGQIFEVMGFVMLAIAIIAVIILLRTTSIGSFGKTILTLAERHEREGVSAGANALFSMTESKSGKSLQELVGIAAYIGNDTIDFGPSISYVDVPQEITWRLDALYGKDHWYMRVPYPKIEAAIQIIFIQDTSSSLCDDVENLRKVLPGLISDLRAAGKRVTATIYLLEGGSPCCGIGSNPSQPYVISCDKFPQSQYLRCSNIGGLQCEDKRRGDPSEDWGHGTACAIEAGPIEGWQKFSVRVVIPISDEVPEGSECGLDTGNPRCCASTPSSYVEQHNSLLRGIEVAKKNGVFAFPIKADPGSGCCPSCSNCDAKCNICVIWQGQTYHDFTQLQCQCSGLVTQYMTEMATATGGQMYDLSKGSDLASALKDVIEKVTPERTGALEAGNRAGYEIAQRTKNIRAVNFPVPVAVAGVYTTANIYEWA
ncbi:MAG: hypothetical protein J4452_02610 [Candidatus Aenigmarchaeota archaeon]|nr:hypothetical protein [Candidatus Aenigmarchaeota archaeon]